MASLGPAAFPIWPLAGDTLPLEKCHGSSLHYLLSPHLAGTRLTPGFSEMFADFTAMHKNHRFLYLSRYSVATPSSSKLGHCHLTILSYLCLLLNNRSLSLPLPVCPSLPLDLTLSSLHLLLVTLF